MSPRQCGGGDAGLALMFGQPVTIITPALGVLREIDGVTKRERSVAAFDDRTKVEDRKPHA